MSPYLSLIRIDNWSKNLLMLVGVGMAYVLSQYQADINSTHIILTFLALCFASSANYVLNESLDAGFDKHHPIKQHRAAAKNSLRKEFIIIEYIALLLSAALLGWFTDGSIVSLLGVYIMAAWLYNIPPVRLKDKAYLDVLLESANYPIRIILGWLCVIPELLPPSSIILTTWAIGAFAMSLKRVAEYRIFKTVEQAAMYRKAYAGYTQHTLIVSAFIYGLLIIFGMSVLMIKYKIELLLLMPILIGWMGQYFLMGLRQDIHIIYPERLIKNKLFIWLALLTMILTMLLLNINIPQLHVLNEPIAYGVP